MTASAPAPQHLALDLRGGVVDRLLRWMWSLIALIFFLIAALPYAAAEEAPTIEGMLAVMGESGAPVASAALPEASTSPLNLEVQWRLWNRAISEGQPGISELSSLRHDATSLGIPSLPNHQLALLHTAHRGEELGLDAQEIRQLKREAHRLAPHLPYAQLDQARWEIVEAPETSYRAINAYRSGTALAYQWLDTRLGWSLKWSLLFLFAAGAAFLGFLLAQLLRYFGVAAYDGTRVLPRGFSSTQTVIVLMAAVLVPGLVLQSPLLSMLLLLVVVVPFQQLNERIVSCGFFALLALLPMVDEGLGDVIVYPGSDAQQLLHAHYHGCEDGCGEQLAELLERRDDDLIRYISTVDTFRSADHEGMQELATWFDDHQVQENSPLVGYWLTLQGAVLISVGDSDRAVEVLGDAADQLPGKAAPWFNKMRALQILDEADSSRQAMEFAFALEADVVSRAMDSGRRDPNSFLIVPRVDAEHFWAFHRAQDLSPPSLLGPVWTVVAGESFALRHAPPFGVAGILLALLTFPLFRARKISVPCPKCGLARDPVDAEKTGDHHYCLPCYKTFVSGAGMDYHARVLSETTLGRRNRLQRFLRRAFSVIAPGVGHILGGHAIRGVLGFTALVAGILMLAFPQGPYGAWRIAHELFQFSWAGQSLVAWGLVSIGAIIGLTGLIRGVESTRLRTSRAKDSGGAP